MAESEIAPKEQTESSYLRRFLDRWRKHLFGVEPQIEVSGGTMNEAGNLYTLTDPESGVTTEYALRKDRRVKTGISVIERSYFTETAADGTKNKIAAEFDEKTEIWVKKGLMGKISDAGEAIKPRYMADLIREQATPDAKPGWRLRIGKARFEEGRIAVGVPPLPIPGPAQR